MTPESGPDPEHVLAPSLLGQYTDSIAVHVISAIGPTPTCAISATGGKKRRSGRFSRKWAPISKTDQLETLAADAQRVIGLPEDEAEFPFEFDDMWGTFDDATDCSHEECQAQKRRL